jgi:protein TonB
MPGELFVQTLAPEVRRSRSGWTLLGSLCAHFALIAILVVVPIVSGASVPLIGDRLSVFVMAAPPPLPPPPPPAVSMPQPLPADIKVDAAPLVPADHLPIEPVTLPAPPGPGVPGGVLPVNPGSGPPAILSTAGPVTLGPPPAPKDPIRVGGDIKAPARIAYAPPVYPPIAIQGRVEGTVILEATIDESGVVKNLRVLRSIPLLDRAAIDAVSRWRYTPTRLNGMAVPVLMTVQVTFTLR